MSEHSEEQEPKTYEEPKEGGEFYQPRISEISQKFLADLEEERSRLGEAFPLCNILIDEAIERLYSTGRIPGREFYADVYKQKPIKITQKVFVPVKQYPKFNFTGKILGPKGNSLRRLQEETQCKIAIKGRNSVRDRNKEEEMRNSNDPRYMHLHKDLFLEISAVATPAESYARIAYALAEIRKYLVPDKNDEVSHEQLRELMEIDPKNAKHISSSIPNVNRSVFERKFTGGSSGPKYMTLIKRHPYSQHPDEAHHQESDEQVEEVYEYEHRVPKRTLPPAGYEYVKARPEASTSSYKRPSATSYTTEIKRVREAPVKPYKPNYSSILNKYK